jgi:effector-binding domain-containing protein
VAADLLWALTSLRTWEDLVLQRRWSPEQYEQRLCDVLLAILTSAHLERLERQLEQTTAAVASLRHEGILSWWRAAFTEIRDVIRALGVEPEGPAGGLYHTELFSQEEGDATVFIPVRAPARTVGRAAPIVIPAAELAVTLHAGSHDDIDRTYGALGTYVQEHEIGIDGPVREFYLVDRFQTDAAAEWRTEIGWPVFQARAR